LSGCAPTLRNTVLIFCTHNNREEHSMYKDVGDLTRIREARVTPLCVPEIRGNEWQYVKECLDGGWVSSAGPFVDRFEREFARYVGAEFAVAAASGTAAIHLALMVAGVAADDEVLVSALTFIAPANAIRYVGAWPVFVDAEPKYWQMDAEKVIDFLDRKCMWRDSALYNKITGRRIRAILPVHILGHPVDMNPILEVARKYDLAVVEDATESLGARYEGQMVGNLGDIGCFSFNGNKIITTGGGGMIVTNNAEFAQKAKYLSTQAKDDAFEYVHKQVGYNYRLTNLQAAVGCAQLEQLPEFVDAKRQLASTYCETLKHVPGLTTMPSAPWAFSTFWLYTILVEDVKHAIDSRNLSRELDKSGIQTRPLWQPLHLSPALRSDHQAPCPTAERLNRDALSLPSSVGLTDEDVRNVTSTIAEILSDGI
jgi:perosamine synthetase